MSGTQASVPAVLHAPGLLLAVDAEGLVTAGAGASGPRWLERSGGLEVDAADGRLVLGPAEVLVDADEVEVVRVGGGLRTVVRHAVDRTWTVRVLLVNETDADLVLPEVRLGWRAASGCVVTAVAAGARATTAVQDAAGDGPVLVGRLRSGNQPAVDEGHLRLGPPTLGPGHRWAAQWRWEVVPAPRDADPRGELPRATWLDLSRAVALPGGPDVAVVAPGLSVEVAADQVEVGAAEPGAYVVELRGARGTTTLELAWAPDLDDLVDRMVTALLAGPATPAGTARLPDAAAALLVQDALLRRSAGTGEALVDALELAAGRLAEPLDAPPPVGGPDPLDLVLLVREADRSGDPTLLDAAVRGVLGLTAAAAGAGLAGVGAALAAVRTGRPAGGLLAHLDRLRAASTPADLPGLELALLLRAPGEDPAPVVAGLRRLGASLGAGLPGRVLPAAAVADVARAATLLGLVAEDTGQALARRWGTSAADLAQRTAAQARARLDPSAGGFEVAGTARARWALAWLVLGRPAG